MTPDQQAKHDEILRLIRRYGEYRHSQSDKNAASAYLELRDYLSAAIVQLCAKPDSALDKISIQNIETAKMKFFRDLSEADRKHMFSIFGIADNVLMEARNRSDERRLFDHLFVKPDSAEQVRNTALEDAATICNRHAQNQQRMHQHAEMYVADFLAREIRGHKTIMDSEKNISNNPVLTDQDIRAIAEKYDTSMDATKRWVLKDVIPFARELIAQYSRPADDELWDKTLKDRDDAEEMADNLADLISRMTDVEIGEHSNLNCPWLNAISAADQFIRSAPLNIAQQAPEASPEIESQLYDAIAEQLADLYACIRVWSAWSYGTMTEYDFHIAGEDEDCVTNVLNAVLPFVAALQTQLTQAQEENARLKKDSVRLSWVIDCGYLDDFKIDEGGENEQENIRESIDDSISQGDYE
jgi:hypothetical protein